MSENRFLQSFSALLASAILVCGTHLLLIASQPDEPQPAVSEMPEVAAPPATTPEIAAPEVSVDVSTGRKSAEPSIERHSDPHPSTSAPVHAPIGSEMTASLPEQPHAIVTPFAGDQTPVASSDATPAQAEAIADSDPVEEQAAEAASSEPAAPSTTDKETVAAAPEPVTPAAGPSESLMPAEPATTTASVAAEDSSPAPTPPAPQIATAESKPEAAKVEPVTSSTPQTAKTEPVAAQSVPIPTPKPAQAADAKKAKPAPKPQAPAPQREEQAAAEPKPRWAPMALAPADKDTVAKPKLSPQRATSAGGYNAKIWSALARHKPKTGKNGSATVTFAIGPGGGLKSARISGSSGDAQLDQMALATVRNAAPFPPPPDPATASYTIRIYFR